VLTRALTPPPHYDLAGSLFPLSIGRDPCARVSRDALLWATRTPDGPATLHLARRGGTLLATGYGAGAEWVLARADALAGLRDDVSGFTQLSRLHPVLARAWHDRPGLRLPASGRIFQHLVPTVLAQKVSGKEAAHSYARVARHFGEPAPGPFEGLLLPPDPAQVAATPYWALHRFGVERKRADALRRVAQEAARLDALAAEGDPTDPATTATLTARLVSVPGIGPWTAAEVVRLGVGDPDVVSVGDYNIPHHVVFALTGAVRAGAREGAPGRLSPADQRMLDVLAPFAGQRGRVCQVLTVGTPGPPRFGPRIQLRSFAHY
jgi:3-methyladenine DNA glycosylase/8-oxoguanine DNA glycosylase